MTLCILVNHDGHTIYVIADSAITGPEAFTRVAAVDGDGRTIDIQQQPSGRTSKGESYQPTTDITGAVTYRREGATKIGTIASKYVAAFSGDAVLCRRLAQELEVSMRGTATSLEDIGAMIDSAAKHAAVAADIAPRARAELLLGFSVTADGTPQLIGLEVSVSVDCGTPHVRLKVLDQNIVNAIGSGSSLLPRSPFPSLERPPDGVEPLALCETMSRMGMIVRERTAHQMSDVGGSYIGLSLVVGKAGTQLVTLPDFVEIVIDELGTVQSATKTIVRGSIYYVHDYVNEVTIIMPPLSSDLTIVEANKSVPAIVEASFRTFTSSAVAISVLGPNGTIRGHWSGYDPTKPWEVVKRDGAKLVLELPADILERLGLKNKPG